MPQKFDCEYSRELDILHIFNENIKEGIIGCLTSENVNVDIGNDKLVVGVEIEGASSAFGFDKESLENLDEVALNAGRWGNNLLISARIIKGSQKSRLNFNLNNLPPKILA